MPTRLTCPNCSARVTRTDELAGKPVKCQECGHVFRPAAAAADDDEPAPRRRRPDDSDDRPARRKKPAPKSNTGLILLIVGGVAALGLLAVCGGVAFWFFHDSKPKEDPAAVAAREQAEAQRQMVQGMERMVQSQFGGAFGGSAPANLNEAVAKIGPGRAADRAAGARWLAQAGVDEGRRAEVVRSLAAMLEDRDDNARLEALRALKTWGTPDAVPAVVRVLADKRFEPTANEIRKTAIQVLGRLKDPRGAAAVAPFLANFFFKDEAANALREIGPAAAPDVIPLLFHPDFGAQQSAQALLREYGTPPAAVAQKAAAVAGSASDHRERLNAAEWLARATPDAAVRPEVEAGLRAVVQAGDIQLRNAAVRALLVWRTPETGAYLAGLLQSPQPDVQLAALDALGKVKDPATAPAMATCLANPTLRDRAVRALEEFGPAAETAVAEQLKSRDSSTVQAAARVLHRIGTKKSVPALQAAEQAARTRSERGLAEFYRRVAEDCATR